MINNAHIQSLFAKAILDVGFLESLAGKSKIYCPGEKKHLPLLPQSIQSLRLFSAFVAKVQHNYLWNDFALTLTTIRKLGIDLEIFGAYLSIHQQNRNERPALGIEEKKNRFVEFFKNYTSGKNDLAFIQAKSVLMHENIYRQAKETPAPAKKQNKRNSNNPVSIKSIPQINGRIWIAELSVNPAIISTMLSSDKPVKIYKHKKRYCYWLRRKDEELRIFEVSKTMAGVLKSIDGKKSISQLSFQNKYSVIKSSLDQKKNIRALAETGIVSCN